MRRRARWTAADPGVLPAELAVGRCIEVWGASPVDVHGAWRSWRTAHEAWRAIVGAPAAASLGFGLWSYQFLSAVGRRAEADARLDRVGVRAADLPSLRAAAVARLEGVSA